eukprot:6486777-Ditylum_brightwellii.AAC.1
MEGYISMNDNDGTMMLASYLFIRSRGKKKLHSCLRKEYVLGLPDNIQSLRHKKLHHLSLVLPYLSQ